MSGRAGTQMMGLHCTAKGFCLIVPPSFFSTFFLILQDFGYFLSRQGAGQTEEVQRFGGGDRVPGDTPARYSPASPHPALALLWAGGAAEVLGFRENWECCWVPQISKPTVPVIGSDVWRLQDLFCHSLSLHLNFVEIQSFCFQYIH